MDQQKIGAFLKSLRKERNLTQEQLAEQFNVAGRTVSRWETGNNMPDLSLLVELAAFYEVEIEEIIDGERRGDGMEEEKKETLEKVAAYSDSGKEAVRRDLRRKIVWMLGGFGLLVIVSAMAVFPSDSSWGGIYAVVGCMVVAAGVFVMFKGRRMRVAVAVASFVLLMSVLVAVDYEGARAGGQVPRFAYEKEWSSEKPGDVVYKAPFYTVVQHDAGSEDDWIEIQ